MINKLFIFWFYYVSIKLKNIVALKVYLLQKQANLTLKHI